MMRRFLPLILVSFLSLPSFAAVEVTRLSRAERGPGVPDEVVAGKILVRSVHLDDYLKDPKPDTVVEKMDSLGGEKPDIFLVYKKNDDGSKLLIMQLFDLNRDGKVDLVKHFEKGKLSKIEQDFKFDGHVEVISDYDPHTGELKKKSQSDGLTNIWKYYTHSELRRKEVDRNNDGKPDMWVYYKNGKVSRTEIDQRFDGKKIVRIDGPLNLAPPEVKASDLDRAD